MTRHFTPRTAVIAALIALASATALALYPLVAPSHTARVNAAEHSRRSARPTGAASSPYASANPRTRPTPRARRPRPSDVEGLPATTLPDRYAVEVATRLLSVDYPNTSRRELLAIGRGQLADSLPLGVPRGTSLHAARTAGLSSIGSVLPSAAMWATLAAAGTVTRFTVTAVTEPPAWLAALGDGQITDPGLAVRLVSGLETSWYRNGSGTRQSSAPESRAPESRAPESRAPESRAPESIVVAMLCPPSVTRCRIEVLPPSGALGS